MQLEMKECSGLLQLCSTRTPFLHIHNTFLSWIYRLGLLLCVKSFNSKVFTYLGDSSPLEQTKAFKDFTLQEELIYMTQLVVNSECSIVTLLYRCPISCYYYICPLNVLCAPEQKFVGMILKPQ